MRELFDVFFLSALMAVSLLLNATGACFSSAGNIVHTYYLRKAVRHDNRFALKDSEKADANAAMEAPAKVNAKELN